jgi:P4 family phage/plasmid primase-like protien
MSAMIEVAKAQPGITVRSDVWDRDLMLFNCKNGTIDLYTGTLRPHSSDDMMTKLSPVDFLPGRTCPRWDGFLKDATGGDEQLLRFLRAYAGYSLTGQTIEEVMAIIYGPKNSGKTTFVEALKTIHGDYGQTFDPEMLMCQRNGRHPSAPSPELARLAGVRLAGGAELEEDRELARALFKNLTGGDRITARRLHRDPFDFIPQHKLILAINHCPQINSADGATWRRILRVDFKRSVPKEKLDKGLKKYLQSTKGGATAVLSWAVQGCLDWQKHGLSIPASVRDSTQQYQTESDPLADFVEDRLQIKEKGWTLWKHIWNAYIGYSKSIGLPDRDMATFGMLQRRLKDLGCKPLRTHNGRGWLNVEIKNRVTA